MRAYRKTTQHPFCIYLTADEAVELINEASEGVNLSFQAGEAAPALADVYVKLNALLADPKRDRA